MKKKTSSLQRYQVTSVDVLFKHDSGIKDPKDSRNTLVVTIPATFNPTTRELTMGTLIPIDRCSKLEYFEAFASGLNALVAQLKAKK